MKNFIKISVIICGLFAITQSAKAQSNSSSNSPIFSIGAESGISSGNFSHDYRWNIGGSIQTDVPVEKSLFFTANAGYLNFYGKDNVNGSTNSAPNIQLLPVMAGLKYFPIHDWYIQGDAGAGFLLNKNEVGYTKTAAFLYTPQIGVLLNVGGSNFIDAGVRYEATSKYISSVENTKINFFELRVAYGFN